MALFSPGTLYDKRHYFLGALVLSLCVHTGVTVFLGLRGGWRGYRAPPGENGALGAGGPEHEISLIEDQAPPSAAPQPDNTPEVSRPATPPSPPVEKTPPPPKLPVKIEAREPDQGDEPALEPLPPPSAAPAPQESALAARPPIKNAPHGDENHGRLSSGRSAGDVNSLSAQRGRLPDAVNCDDPAEGVWVSTKFMPERDEWYVFRLTISRSGNSLRGTVTSNFWTGHALQSKAPRCFGDGTDPLQAVVTMTGAGSLDGLKMVFGGKNISSMKTVCPNTRAFPVYAVDTFTGTLDPERQEFRSIGNDGGQMHDVPLLFRRTSCSK
jgi:hypothetical protein